MFTFVVYLLINSVYAQTRVAVIDTGLDLNDSRFKNVLCKNGHKDFTHTSINDTEGHGTHVAGLIKTYADSLDYCLLIYKFYLPNRHNERSEVSAIKEAIKNKANIVNISAGGYTFIKEEFELIKNNPKIMFIAAAGNNGINIDINKYYPAGYELLNVIAVGNMTSNLIADITSNYGKNIVWEEGMNIKSYGLNGSESVMSGTSMSAAIYTGKLLHYILNYSKVNTRNKK